MADHQPVSSATAAAATSAVATSFSFKFDANRQTAVETASYDVDLTQGLRGAHWSSSACSPCRRDQGNREPILTMPLFTGSWHEWLHKHLVVLLASVLVLEHHSIIYILDFFFLVNCTDDDFFCPLPLRLVRIRPCGDKFFSTATERIPA